MYYASVVHATICRACITLYYFGPPGHLQVVTQSWGCPKLPVLGSSWQICAITLAHCTLNTTHCTPHTLFCIIQTEHTSLEYIWVSGLSEQCTVNSVWWTLDNEHCTLHTTYCTLHTAHCTLHIPHYSLQTAHCTMHTTHRLYPGELWPQAPGKATLSHTHRPLDSSVHSR